MKLMTRIIAVSLTTVGLVSLPYFMYRPPAQATPVSIVSIGKPCKSCTHQRSPAARREFVKANPCPIAAKKGTCPGWNVDHKIPLSCGGLDSPANMQWLTVEAHKAKTKREKRCVL